MVEIVEVELKIGALLRMYPYLSCISAMFLLLLLINSKPKIIKCMRIRFNSISLTANYNLKI